MVDLVYCLTNVLFFHIPLSYYYINLRSSITFCLSSRDILVGHIILPEWESPFENTFFLFCNLNHSRILGYRQIF